MKRRFTTGLVLSACERVLVGFGQFWFIARGRWVCGWVWVIVATAIANAFCKPAKQA